jgi:YD repeat-containing protein
MARIPDIELERLKSEVSLQRLVEAKGIGEKRVRSCTNTFDVLRIQYRPSDTLDISVSRRNVIDYPTTVDTDHSYDTCPNGVGRLCGVTDESGSTSYEYDPRGNVTKKTVTVNGVSGSFSTRYEYDGADRLTAMIYPSTRRVDYTRDPATGRITGATTRSGGLAQPLVSTVN